MRYLVLVLLLGLCSCHSENNFSIDGHLSGTKFDKEQIYLIPIENATTETVDSTVIKNGSFKFQGKVICSDICILRAKPILRLSLEELLIIREPGNLTVKLDKSSSVHGTPLNDSLQYWKERKMRYDFVNAELVKRYHEADDESVKQGLKLKQDSLQILSNRFHFNFVLRNKDNIVGQFAQKVMAGSFTEEQKQALNKK